MRHHRLIRDSDVMMNLFRELPRCTCERRAFQSSVCCKHRTEIHDLLHSNSEQSVLEREIADNSLLQIRVLAF